MKGLLEIEIGVDLDANGILHRLVGGTAGRMEFQRPFGFGLLVLGDFDVITDPDLRDLDRLVHFLDIAFHGGVKVIRRGFDLARSQRAGKSADKSSTHRADHVIQRRRMLLFGLNSVKLGDAAVDAVGEGLFEVLDEGPAQRRPVLDDLDVTGVNDLSHGMLLVNPVNRTRPGV